MENVSEKLIERAKTAKSPEELLQIAQENGVEMTADGAATYFAQLGPKSGELDDDELDNVAGGACSKSSDGPNCPNCNTALKSTVGSEDTMKYKCPSCNAEFAAYMKEGFAILHPVK